MSQASGPSNRRAQRGRGVLGLAATVLVVIGVAKICHAQQTPSGPPRPPAYAAGAHSFDPAASPAASAAAVAAMDYALPVHIDIPDAAIHADIMSLGPGPDETLGVPPLNQAKTAGWFNRSPAPGQTGAAIIDAHVDSALMKDYRGAFYTLGEVRPGQQVDITRADHTIAVFTVDEIQLAAKSAFPADKVYAPTTYPALRLVTCGGSYDYKTHEYLDNTIVYAHLTSEKPA